MTSLVELQSERAERAKALEVLLNDGELQRLEQRLDALNAKMEEGAITLAEAEERAALGRQLYEREATLDAMRRSARARLDAIDTEIHAAVVADYSRLTADDRKQAAASLREAQQAVARLVATRERLEREHGQAIEDVGPARVHTRMPGLVASMDVEPGINSLDAAQAVWQANVQYSQQQRPPAVPERPEPATEREPLMIDMVTGERIAS